MGSHRDRSLVRPFSVARPFLPTTATRFRAGSAQPGRPHTGTRTQRREGRPPRRPDAAPATAACRRCAASSARSPTAMTGAGAVAGRRGQVTLRDARTLQPGGELKGLRTTVPACLLTRRPASRRRRTGHRSGPGADLEHGRERADVGCPLARADDGALELRRLRSRSVPTQLPRGRSELGWSDGGPDARSRGLIVTLPTPDLGRSVAFSPDGVCSPPATTTDRPALSTKSWKPVGPARGHNEKRFPWMELTPDDTMPASAAGRAVALWDVETRTRSDERCRSSPTATSPPTCRPTARACTSLPQPASRPLGRRPEAWKQHVCVSRAASSHTGSGPTRCPTGRTDRLPAG